MASKSVVAIILAILVTLIIFLSPISFSSFITCKCGGCCEGCPGDCEALGTPLAYFYWGENKTTGDVVSKFSVLGLSVDLVVLFLVLVIGYRIYFKKRILQTNS